MTEAIQSIFYNQASDDLRREIALLQYRAEPNDDSTPDELTSSLHDPSLDAVSFYLMSEGLMVSYAAVVRKTIQHDGETFSIAGLSCVATDKAYQGRGFGLRTVAAATKWIEQSKADFGIFTCDPPLARFYALAGDWPVVADVTLIGSRDEGALCSASLQKVVLMRLFSAKAIAAAPRLRQTTIDLGLPVGQFW